MWYLPIGVATIFVINMFTFKFGFKSVSSSSTASESDFQKIKKLYTFIRNTKAKKEITLGDKLKGIITSIYDTIKVSAKIKRDNIMLKLYGPVRLNDNYIVFDYYSVFKWHRALVYHPVHVSSPKIKLKKVLASKSIVSDIDITEEIIAMYGPKGDFYGHKVTPELLGYDSLNIHIENSSKILPSAKINKTTDTWLKFEKHDIINLN